MFVLTILAMFAADPDFAAFQAGPPAAMPSPYQWRFWDADPDRHYLYRDGKQIGAYCHRTKKYRSYDAKAGTWSAPTDYVPHLPLPSPRSRLNPVASLATLACRGKVMAT